VQGLAAIVIDPNTVFVTVGETSESLTLDMNGNCEREMLSGWFLNTLFCVISHASNVLRECCRLQVTGDGVFPYQRDDLKRLVYSQPAQAQILIGLIRYIQNVTST
jgi:hypothetical protein